MKKSAVCLDLQFKRGSRRQPSQLIFGWNSVLMRQLGKKCIQSGQGPCTETLQGGSAILTAQRVALRSLNTSAYGLQRCACEHASSSATVFAPFQVVAVDTFLGDAHVLWERTAEALGLKPRQGSPTFFHIQRRGTICSDQMAL